MKRRFLQKTPLIFFISALLLAFTFVERAKMQANSGSKTQPILRMANTITKSVRSLDPARIQVLEEYNLIDNLYGRLVEYNISNELVAGVAKSFAWESDSLVFDFDGKATTIDGHAINADDAAASLRRAIFYKRTGHTDIREFLCPGRKLSSIDDDCEGIKVSGNRLFLKPVHRSYRPHLLTILESADFSIIPRSSLSDDPKNPSIVDFRNTSGPYYVSADDDQGSWTIRANPRHFHYTSEMPQEVKLVVADFETINSLFENGQIDIAPPAIPLNGEFALRSRMGLETVNVHETIPIQTFSLYFSPRAVREFSPEQRFYVANIISKAQQKLFPVPEMKPSIEFLQALSDGSISDKQRAEIQSLRAQPGHPKFNRPLTLSISKANEAVWREELKSFSEIRVVGTESSLFETSPESRPDISFGFNDAAWSESLSLIGYNFFSGTFYLPEIKAADWIHVYIETEDREARIQKLRALHFELLRRAVIYPLASGPYYSYSTKHWELGFSTYGGGSELWRVRFKP